MAEPTADGYVCPNGHAFPASVVVRCECGAGVTCIPLAVWLAGPDPEETERYRRALLRIAGEESGVWGVIAAQALSDA